MPRNRLVDRVANGAFSTQKEVAAYRRYRRGRTCDSYIPTEEEQAAADRYQAVQRRRRRVTQDFKDEPLAFTGHLMALQQEAAAVRAALEILPVSEEFLLFAKSMEEGALAIATGLREHYDGTGAARMEEELQQCGPAEIRQAAQEERAKRTKRTK